MGRILAIDGLRKAYGDRIAVDGVSFSLDEGEILGLLGPNGAGKTTIIRMIMNIVSPDEGTVKMHINGASGLLPKEKIGYLPEARGLYEDVRVIDNLIYLGTLKGMTRARAKGRALHWLDRLELGDYAYSKLEQLSKGMQQKVQFISAVLHSPRLLILDEPLSGLDPVNQDLFKDLIRSMQKEGIGILLSAHQMNVVEELCDRIFLIDRGRRVFYGDIAEMKRRHPETVIEFSASRDSDLSFLDSLEKVRVISRRNGTASLRYSGEEMPAEIVSYLSERLELREISVRKPPLHEIFVRTVSQRGDDNAAY